MMQIIKLSSAFLMNISLTLGIFFSLPSLAVTETKSFTSLKDLKSSQNSENFCMVKLRSVEENFVYDLICETEYKDINKKSERKFSQSSSFPEEAIAIAQIRNDQHNDDCEIIVDIKEDNIYRVMCMKETYRVEINTSIPEQHTRENLVQELGFNNRWHADRLACYLRDIKKINCKTEYDKDDKVNGSLYVSCPSHPNLTVKDVDLMGFQNANCNQTLQIEEENSLGTVIESGEGMTHFLTLEDAVSYNKKHENNHCLVEKKTVIHDSRKESEVFFLLCSSESLLQVEKFVQIGAYSVEANLLLNWNHAENDENKNCLVEVLGQLKRLKCETK